MCIRQAFCLKTFPDIDASYFWGLCHIATVCISDHFTMLQFSYSYTITGNVYAMYCVNNIIIVTMHIIYKEHLFHLSPLQCQAQPVGIQNFSVPHIYTDVYTVLDCFYVAQCMPIEFIYYNYMFIRHLQMNRQMLEQITTEELFNTRRLDMEIFIIYIYKT